MFGLTRDFTRHEGMRMVLGVQEEISASRIHSIQSRMLTTLDIPHHLRLFIKEIDMNVTLEYHVSGKKLLSHLLKGTRLTLSALYGLLLQIVQGIEEGRLHMLSPERYALHEDYIFVEGPLQRGKVFLTYVPLQMEEPVRPLGDSLKGLILVMMPQITELRGDGLQRLLHYCGEEDFSVNGCKELLSALFMESEEEGQSGQHADYAPALHTKAEDVPVERLFWEKEPENSIRFSARDQDNAQGAPNLGTAVADKSASAGRSLPSVEDWLKSWGTAGQGVKAGRNANEMKEETKEESEDDKPVGGTDKGAPVKTYVLLGSVLLDALLWKYLYLDHPAETGLLVCGAVSVLLIAVCGLTWLGKWEAVWPGNKMRTRNRSEAEEEELSASRESADMPFFRGADFGGFLKGGKQPQSASPKESLRVNPIWEGKPAEASTKPQLGESGPATVLLVHDKNEAKQREQPRAVQPYLERKGAGTESSEGIERIELNRTSFIIGRSQEVAQYVELSEGASRVHAEVSRSGGGYVLKDLDSRNGTRFRGETMVPYKEYPLTDGDTFTIIKGSYTFRQQ
ncbi:FHA domain protein [compost metagenome]